MFLFASAVISLAIFWGSPAPGAGPRMVSFSSVATNRVARPIGKSVSSTCTLSITNPSETKQEVELTANIIASGSFAGAAKLITPATNPSAAITLAPKTGAQSLTYEYPAIPANAVGTQTLICSGQITVKTAPSAGFISASGVITTFHEASRMTDPNDSSKKNLIASGTSGLFKALSFSINQGKPF